MKKKILTMAVVAASLMGSQLVMANEGLRGDGKHNDLAFAFGDSSSMNFAPLSKTEMAETEGEFFWFGIPIMMAIRLAAPHVGRYVASSSSAGALGGVGGAHIKYENNNVPYSDRNYGLDAVTGGVAGTVGGIYGPLGAGAAGMYGSSNYGYQPPGNAGFGPNRP